MIVEMTKLACCPEMILEPGKRYNLPAAKARDFIAAGAAKAITGPCKVTRVPEQPDPEDHPEVEEDEEILAEQDEEDDD